MSSHYTVKLNWQYMACLTDGEGHIYIPPNRDGVKQQVHIAWAQAEHNAHWFDHVVAFLSGEGIVLSDGRYVSTTGHPYRKVAITRQASVEKCLRSMLRYLILKEPQAREGLALLKRQDLARQKRRKMCVRGHIRTDNSTYTYAKTGKIMCRICRNENQRRYRRAS